MEARPIVAAVALLLLMALLAGCFGDRSSPPAEPGPAPGPPGPTPLFFRSGGCNNALLFQFVDYSMTDEYLPPGFHPRDPKEFLNTQVAVGQAGIIFLVLSCAGAPEPWAVAQLGIFVEAPIVPGLPPARYDFYEIVRYGLDPFSGILAQAGWPLIPMSTVASDFRVGITGETVFGFANVTDPLGPVASLTGAGDVPVMLGPSVVRFWHDGLDGLAYQEYAADLEARVGSGTCSARQGTPLATFATAEVPTPQPPPLPIVGPVSCPPGDPVMASFVTKVDVLNQVPPSIVPFQVNATARFLPGVHAE